MTVCIAAITDEGAIVSVTDAVLSMQSFSAETLPKGERIAKNWWTMFSGDDVSYVRSVVDRASHFISQGSKTFEEVRHDFVQAYLEEVRYQIESQVLGRYDVNLKTFRQEGARSFTPDVYKDICGRVDEVKLGCRFLVFGFDRAGLPHIFTVGETKDGVTDKPYDDIGFWAIGTGAQSALSSLFFHKHNRHRNLPLAIYHMCEAKFMAESARGVGKDITSVFVITKEGKAAFLEEDDIKAIRKKWREEGAPTVPPDIVETIEKSMLTWDQMEEWDSPTKPKP